MTELTGGMGLIGAVVAATSIGSAAMLWVIAGEQIKAIQEREWLYLCALTVAGVTPGLWLGLVGVAVTRAF